MIAGPSEVLILADGDANPDWIAADLLAQAEHDAAAQAILDHRRRGSRRRGRGRGRAADCGRCRGPRSPARAGAIRRDHPGARRSTSAVPLVDRLAPEHLEIDDRERGAISPRKIRNAGAIFLGGHTPEAIGDYVGGPNHVLPTARSARFSSGLGVLDFMKRTSILKCGPSSLAGARSGRHRAGSRGGARGACALGRDPPEPVTDGSDAMANERRADAWSP